MSETAAIKTKIQIEELTPLPRNATVYAIKELVRRAGVSAEQFQTWRIEFEDPGFVDLYVLPPTKRRVRFPQADLWYWRELHAGQFRTSTAGWMRPSPLKYKSVPQFWIPFSSDPRGDVGPLFSPIGPNSVECPVDLPASILLTLARFEETFPGQRDEHGRFSASSSIACQE